MLMGLKRAKPREVIRNQRRHDYEFPLGKWEP